MEVIIMTEEKARFESIKNEVTFIPKDSVYMNGLMQVLTSRQHELTKSEILAFAVELDYQLQMVLSADTANEIYTNLFSKDSGTSALADKLGVYED